MYKLFIFCKILLLKSLQEQEDNTCASYYHWR